MKTGGSLTLKGGCSDCEAVGNLLLQLQPLFGALGIPLCLIKCGAAVVGMATALGDVVTGLPAPDVTAILTAIEKVVTNCSCVLELVDPTGVCSFTRMVRDFLKLAISICECVLGLMSHLLVLNLKATALQLGVDDSGKPYDVSIIESGKCLGNYTAVTQNNVLLKFEILSVIFALLEGVFTFIEAVAGPLPVSFGEIKDAFTSFTDSTSVPNVLPGEVIGYLNTLKDYLQGAYDLLDLPGCTT